MKEIIKQVDKDQSGEIEFGEFATMMHKVLFELWRGALFFPKYDAAFFFFSNSVWWVAMWVVVCATHDVTIPNLNQL